MAGGSSEKYYISSETTDGYINDEILIEFNFASPQGTPVSNLYVNDVSVIYVFEDNELIDTFDFLSKYNGFNYIPTTIGTHTIFCTTENNPNSTNKSNNLTFTIKSKGIWDNAISKIVNGIKILINNHNTDINSHSSLFDAKVNVSDVKDNLTSTDTNKPLSANQGKVLKALLDGKADINSIPTETSDLITGIDDIVLELTSYGNTLNGAIVTINLEVMESRSGFTNGMGMFLFDTETTYNDFNDLRANVDYSAFIPLEPNETSISPTDGFEHQFVFNNVVSGEYYVVLCDYDENNLPLLRQVSSSNLLAYINEDESNVENRYLNSMPYESGDKPIIEVVANGTNVWYARTDY